jgi:hypothetical protein
MQRKNTPAFLCVRPAKQGKMLKHAAQGRTLRGSVNGCRLKAGQGSSSLLILHSIMQCRVCNRLHLIFLLLLLGLSFSLVFCLPQICSLSTSVNFMRCVQGWQDRLNTPYMTLYGDVSAEV